MEPTPKELFSVLVRDYGPGVVVLMQACLARADVRDCALADDLIQETFRSAWQHFDRYDRNRPFRDWLHAIARNKVKEYFRRAKMEKRHVQWITPEDIDAVCEACESLIPDRGGVWEDRMAAVRECLGTVLERMDRDIVEQVYRENRTSEAVAHLIGVSARTVRRRLQEARDRLRDCVLAKLKARLLRG